MSRGTFFECPGHELMKVEARAQDVYVKNEQNQQNEEENLGPSQVKKERLFYWRNG